MTETYDRKTFFDMVREDPFPGELTQQQVDGMSYKLEVWEEEWEGADVRWLANCLAQCYHETSAKMWPIEEYGKGGSADYAKTDPVTGQKYYGRGDIQLTWRENYRRADVELGLEGEHSCEWHAENALDPEISAAIMYQGMVVGWFRSDSHGPQNLPRYFNATTDDPLGAREIVNGDARKVPSWSSGASIGQLIVGYHNAFLKALKASFREDEVPSPEPARGVVRLTIEAPADIKVEVQIVEPEA